MKMKMKMRISKRRLPITFIHFADLPESEP